MYSTRTAIAKAVATELGFRPEVGFVTVMRRAGRIYVSGTVGKPEEWWALRRATERAGYLYRGRP